MDERTRRAALGALRSELRTEIWQLSRLLELAPPATAAWNEAALIETVVDLRSRAGRFARRLMASPGRVSA